MRSKKKLCTIIIMLSTLLNMSYLQTAISAAPKQEILINDANVTTVIDKVEIGSSLILNDTIVPNIIQKVSPSVVGIIGSYGTGNYNDVSSDYLAHGSGVIIKSNGEILTNAHVIKDLKNIVVVLHDGSAYNAKVKNTDEKSDLAVIKIDKVGLPIVTFASMDTVVTGKSVIAIGTPLSFSFRNSASMGIISGINRGVGSEYALIQTDAAINPGNSGGPLVNLAGEVVGINSSKFSAVGVESIGFSIPSDTVTYVISHFDQYGVVVRPQLGAEFEESWAARMGLPTKSGLTVKKVEANSAAQKAGLQASDVILSIGGVSVNSKVDLNECLKKYLPGNSCSAVINRNEKKMEINILF